VQLLAKSSRPHDAVLGRIPGTTAFREAATNPGTETFPGLVIYRFDSAVVFFNADHFKTRAQAVVRTAPAPVRYLVLDAGAINQLDTTGAASLDRLCGDLQDQGVAIAVAGAKSAVRTMLQKTGLADRIGPDRMFHTLEAAVDALSEDHAITPSKGATL
jgi:SulP family sulfate permease